MLDPKQLLAWKAWLFALAFDCSGVCLLSVALYPLCTALLALILVLWLFLWIVPHYLAGIGNGFGEGTCWVLQSWAAKRNWLLDLLQ